MKRFTYLQNTKLVQLLAALCTDPTYSYADLVSFVEYRLGRSKKKKPLKLLSFLQPYAPFSEGSLKKLSDKGAYQTLFGQNTMPNERSLDNEVSDLYQLVEEYIVFTSTKIQPFSSPAVFLLQFYAKNRLKRNFDDYYRTIIAKSVTNNTLNTRVYYELFAIAQTRFDFQLLLLEEQDLDPKEVVKPFHLHLVTDQLQQAIQILNYQESFTTATTLPFLATTLDQIEQHPEWLNEPLIGIYYYVYRGLTEKKVEYHDKLMEKIAAYQLNLQQTELNDLLIYAVNMMIYIVNAGNKTDENYRRMFNVYQKRQELRLIYQTDGSISPHEYKNIVAVALRLNELDWAEDFNEKHSDRSALYTTDNNKVYIFNRARIAFERRQYEKIFSDLLQQDFKDDILDTNTEILLLKALFEQAQTDSSIYENLTIRLEKFRNRLQRKKVFSETLQNSFLQFAEVVQKIVRILEVYRKTTDKTKELAKIQAFVLENSTIVEQKWLLDKLKR